MPIMPDDIVKMLGADADNRRNAVRECVTWLAQNHDKYKPEFLAGYMADELINK